MTPGDIKLQQDFDQAREMMADKVMVLQEQAPDFLLAVYDAIEV